MGFTAGYKVNEGTQYEFTVSDETLPEVVQGGGITDGDISEYCYTALYDSRVYKLIAEAPGVGWPDTTGSAIVSYAKEHCACYMAGSTPLTSQIPTFNKEILDSEDKVYQRNFLVWEGTIYPNTENAKTGTFLVMDMKDIKRWYVNFDNAGFFTDSVTSAIGETPPTGYVWPGYTGPIYGYISNTAASPEMHCDNNNPQLNPNTNIKVKNVLVINDELWVGSLNPSTHGTSYLGSSSCVVAWNSLVGWNWGAGNTASYLHSGEHYQSGSLNFMGVPNYAGAPELPGAPRADIGSLGFACYAQCNNDNMIMPLNGGWGQQNYASSTVSDIGSNSTAETTLLKWQSWCGLKFQYKDTMYKPIIEGGIVVGYSSNMNAPSEYDEMSNVTGNNIPSGPPKEHESMSSDESYYNNAYTTGVPSSQLYAMTLSQINDMFDKLTDGGLTPANFEPGNAVISIQRYPFSLSSFASAVESNITWTAKPDVIGPETPTRILFPPTGHEITGYPVYNAVKRVSLGSFSLSEFWVNYIAFLNREISASLYIPFCGIIDIDINAILGKTIKVYLTIDIISGGCTAAVDINGCMYTTVSGHCSSDMYFSTSNYGSIRAALRSNTAEQVYNVAQLAAGAIGAAASGGLTAGWGVQAATGAGFNILGKAIKRTMMRSGVTPSVHGSAGDMSGWTLPMHCQLIFSLPRPNHKSDSIYGHSHSFITTQKMNLSNCSGLTVCDNPDVSSISTATDSERVEIYNMLENGVYL